MAIDASILTQPLVGVDTSPLWQVAAIKEQRKQLQLENERQNKLDQLAMMQFQENIKQNRLVNERADFNAQTNRMNAAANAEARRMEAELQEPRLESARAMARTERLQADAMSLPVAMASMQIPLEAIVASLEAGHESPPEDLVQEFLVRSSENIETFRGGELEGMFRGLDTSVRKMLQDGSDSSVEDVASRFGQLNSMMQKEQGQRFVTREIGGVKVQVDQETGRQYASPLNEPPTQGQYAAAGYAGAMDQSNSTLAEFGEIMTSWDTRIAKEIFNEMRTEEQQRFFRAERSFINALLRRESGAAIAPSEFESARQQYIPQPGDSLIVLQEKAENRRIRIQNLVNEGGRAWTELQDSLGPVTGVKFDDWIGQ